MDVLRTPDARFGDLVDYDYEPRYADVPRGDGPFAGAGHFLQEDKGAELGRVVADFVRAT